jgi:vacuolar iron transporter family protein
LIGDGFSMAAGNYLGTRAEEQLRETAQQTEGRHIDTVPDGEREEVRQIFGSMGFAGEQLDRAVEVITSDRQRWIETMLKEEYGLPLTKKSPIRAAASTFLAFLFVGTIPLLPFFIGWFAGAWTRGIYTWSTMLTGAAFFLVGAAKSRFVMQSWHSSGLETLIVGGIAAALAYVMGALLGNMV